MTQSRTKYVGFALTAIFCVAAVGLFCAHFINQTWLKPRAVGLEAQQKLESILRENDIDGRVSVVFYDERVRVFSDSMTLSEARHLVPTLKHIYWLRLVDFRKTILSRSEIQQLRDELSPIVVVGKDEIAAQKFEE